MDVYQHSECRYNYKFGPQEPVSCPKTSPIPTCSNPTQGFDLLCSAENVWECKACGFVVIAGTQPDRCPAESGLPACSNPTSGTFQLICGCS